MFSYVHSVFAPVLSLLGSMLFVVSLVLLGGFALFLIIFFHVVKCSPFTLSVARLQEAAINNKYLDLLRYILIDFMERDLHRGEFREYGFTFFVGRQGAGKTTAMVQYLETLKALYPNCLVVTNFGYCNSDYIMTDWRDLLNIRNGTDGVVFAIDEIHSEYSAASWKDVPEALLSEISQQRKQRIKIVATAQFFARVAKPLREQASTVVVCKTHFKRLTRTFTYDALDYALMLDSPSCRGKLRPLAKNSFVQTDRLRSCFDTYEKIERMGRMEFIPRSQRASL